MATKHHVILFDIDGALIISGGAGAASWRLAFYELYGIPADIGKFTDTGMTDPDVARRARTQRVSSAWGWRATTSTLTSSKRAAQTMSSPR